ncbi:hypothetical protein NSTC731_00399 [Nostoc sp. DSM 114167]|jgi:hypothetical protein
MLKVSFECMSHKSNFCLLSCNQRQILLQYFIRIRVSEPARPQLDSPSHETNRGLSKSKVILLAENTQMRKHSSILSKSKVILLAENTEMRKHLSILSKSKVILLAENTEMRKHSSILSKSNAILRKHLSILSK